jgi:hypothetical protein
MVALGIVHLGMVVLGIVASRNGRSRNGHVRNGRSRIGTSTPSMIYLRSRSFRITQKIERGKKYTFTTLLLTVRVCVAKF